MWRGVIAEGFVHAVAAPDGVMMPCGCRWMLRILCSTGVFEPLVLVRVGFEMYVIYVMCDVGRVTCQVSRVKCEMYDGY
jgi:hypothetical protein